MNSPMIFALIGAVLFIAGATGIILQAHLLRKVIAFNVMSSGACLTLVGLGQRDGSIDPVPQAMVLTGIVVTIAATALALALARRLLNLTGEMRLPGAGPDD